MVTPAEDIAAIMPAEAQTYVPCHCAEREELIRRVRSTAEIVKRLQSELKKLSRNPGSRRARHNRPLNRSCSLMASLQEGRSGLSNIRPTHRHRQSRNVRSESPPPAYDFICNQRPQSPSFPANERIHRVPRHTSATRTTTMPTRVGKATRFATRVIGLAWALWDF